MIGSISLLTWGLLFGSVCSLEAWDDILDFLLLTKKKNKKKTEYGRNRYQNMYEEGKEKLKEYQIL